MHVNVNRLCCLLLPLVLGTSQPALAQSKNSASGNSDAQAGYRLGERLPQSKKRDGAGSYKETSWEALVPKGWDPADMFKDLDLSKMSDGDPRAMDALQRMRDAMDSAPIESSMKGARIRIPGFIVPLENNHGKITEFLLVPYFGACIHSPPPPANQTIHVFPAKPVEDSQQMDPVWVSGTLETTSSKTVFGSAGYRMKAEVIKPYRK